MIPRGFKPPPPIPCQPCPLVHGCDRAAAANGAPRCPVLGVRGPGSGLAKPIPVRRLGASQAGGAA